MMLRNAATGLAGLLVLASCGSGGDRAAMQSALEEAGLDAETSVCMAEKAEADMDRDLYRAMVDAARSDTGRLDQLTVAQQGALGAFLLEAAVDCSPLNLE
ncbi:MAG: hypothetical protein AAGH87_07165 [Pseudomonadota bacterium]